MNFKHKVEGLEAEWLLKCHGKTLYSKERLFFDKKHELHLKPDVWLVKVKKGVILPMPDDLFKKSYEEVTNA